MDENFQITILQFENGTGVNGAEQINVKRGRYEYLSTCIEAFRDCSTQLVLSYF